MSRLFFALTLASCVIAGCNRGAQRDRSGSLGSEIASDDKKFVVLGTMTDQFDRAKAKANAEDVITRHADLAGTAGLFEYNPPLILEALERMGKLGQVKVMGFDENPATLKGIKEGTVVATVVQNPYQYGYESIRILNELHKGNKSVIPENKFIDIPARVIDKSNVDAFSKEISDRLGKKDTAESKESKQDKSRASYAFITNGVADFWEHARAGANAAGKDLGVDVVVIMPSNLTDQTRKIEDLLTRGIDGIAISAIDPKNQTDIINKAAEQTNVISHDSDAPQTKRLLYIGMDNYRAGLMCGKTLRDAMPEGGKVMIFIGRLDQDNAERRCRGFVDAFIGRPPATHE
jgi:ribose transport system substrate-binding protein